MDRIKTFLLYFNFLGHSWNGSRRNGTFLFRFRVDRRFRTRDPRQISPNHCSKHLQVSILPTFQDQFFVQIKELCAAFLFFLFASAFKKKKFCNKSTYKMLVKLTTVTTSTRYMQPCRTSTPTGLPGKNPQLIIS